MKTIIASLSLLAMSVSGYAGNPETWEDLLDVPLDDEWQQIFGVALNQNEPREAETFAEKLVAIQDLIAKTHKGIRIPFFIPPEGAIGKWPAQPKTPEDELRIGLEPTGVPVREALQYVATLIGYTTVITDDGFLFKPRAGATKKAASNKETQPTATKP